MEEQGRHERGTDEREAARVRHGFATPLARAIVEDDDDPLVAASGTMRGPDEAPAVLAAEVERQRAEGGPFADTSVLRAAEQDASLGPVPERALDVVEGPWSGGDAGPLAPVWSGEGGGDPGDEQPDPHHVETVKVVAIRDAEGQLVKMLPISAEVTLASLPDGAFVAAEEWPVSALLPDMQTAMLGGAGQLPSDDGRPVVYAPYGTLTDDALQKLEELGIDVQEVSDDDEPEGDGPKAQGYSELGLLNETAVRDVDETGTVRELRVLPGGAVDLAPRRKVQVWIDLRFQYESEHPYGADDMLEEGRIRRFGKLVEQFATLAVENGEAEGMAIPTVTAHVLDKPDDPTAG